MSVKLDAWGVLPVFYRQSSDGWGHANGPLVKLPEKHGPELLAHEIFHVKQWYLWSGLPLLSAAAPFVRAELIVVPIIAIAASTVLWRIPKFRVRREAAAYGESIRVLAPESSAALDRYINHYAKTLDTADAYSYEGETLEALAAMIRARFKDGRLF